MRIVFMGTPDFAVPSLEALIARGDTVVGVFTQPDKPKGRGKKLTPPPVKVAAEAHGIPVFQPRRIRKDGLEDLKALAPDLCVTAAFGQILSQEILDIPRLGTINVHASLLPRHRGSAPIAWGILQGDKQAGITTMFTDKGIDRRHAPAFCRGRSSRRDLRRTDRPSEQAGCAGADRHPERLGGRRPDPRSAG